MNQENSRGQQKFTDFIAEAKIRTQHTESNKNFHGTRFAQTPGNFYCFLVNAAKFLMPRFAVYHPYYMFDLVCYVFISYYTNANYKKIYNLRYYVSKKLLQYCCLE